MYTCGKPSATGVKKPGDGDSSKVWGFDVVLQHRGPTQRGPGMTERQTEPGEEQVALSGYHALAGVSHAAGLVQEAAILQLLAEPLQSVERLVELHRH